MSYTAAKGVKYEVRNGDGRLLGTIRLDRQVQFGEVIRMAAMPRMPTTLTQLAKPAKLLPIREVTLHAQLLAVDGVATILYLKLLSGSPSGMHGFRSC